MKLYVIRRCLLNGVGEAVPGDFSAYPVADFLLASEVFGFPTDIEVNLISFVVFNGVGVTLDACDGPPNGLPRRTGPRSRLTGT